MVKSKQIMVNIVILDAGKQSPRVQLSLRPKNLN